MIREEFLRLAADFTTTAFRWPGDNPGRLRHAAVDLPETGRPAQPYPLESAGRQKGHTD